MKSASFFRRAIEYFTPSAERTNATWTIERCDQLFCHFMSWSSVRTRVTSLYAATDLRKVKDFSPDAPRSTALSRTLSICLTFVLDDLQSGTLHIYRGVLSGRGADSAALAKNIINHMAGSGAIKLDELEAEEAAVDLIVQSSG